MKDPDKVSYCLYYNDKTKCYSTLEQIENDVDLPEFALFSLTKRAYNPIITLFEFSLYSDSFYDLGGSLKF